jgi:protein dithiol:quinone oxidoreductase
VLAASGFGEKVWGSLVLLLAGVGTATASYQTWLQLQPPGSASCAGSQPNLIEQLVYALSDNIPSLFEVSGLCENEELVILGLSLANWALVSFLSAFIAAAWTLFGKLKNADQA